MSETTQSFVDQDLGPTAPARRSLGWGKIALGCLGTLVAIWLLGGGGIWLYLHRQHQQALRDVQAEVDRIHAAGEPITPEDMFAFHQVPPGTNDTTKLWQGAFELVEKTQDEDAKLLPLLGEEEVAYERLRADHPESVAPIAERYFENHDDVIQAILEAARADGEARFPVDFSKGMLAELPHIDGQRQISLMLCLRSRFALARGDTETALESIESLLGAATALDHDPVLISQSVRLASLDLYRSQLQAILSEATLDDSQLSRLQFALAKIDARNGLRLAMLGERAMGFHTFQHSDAKMLFATYDGKPDRPADCRCFLDVMRELIAAADEPVPNALEKMKETLSRLDAKIHSKNPFVRLEVTVTALLAPSSEYAFEGAASFQARRDSCIAGIAFRRYQLKYGKPPEFLERLVPEFLEAVPQDPFVRGTPLKLRNTDSRFAVYSAGPNLTDDRGLLKDLETHDDDGFVASLAVPGTKTQANRAATESSEEAVP